MQAATALLLLFQMYSWYFLLLLFSRSCTLLRTSQIWLVCLPCLPQAKSHTPLLTFRCSYCWSKLPPSPLCSFKHTCSSEIASSREAMKCFEAHTYVTLEDHNLYIFVLKSMFILMLSMFINIANVYFITEFSVF